MKENEILEIVETSLDDGKAENVVVIDEPLMTTEDFGCYVDHASGSFYHIGAGCEYSLHSPYFIPTEKAHETAVKMHVAVVKEYLKQD